MTAAGHSMALADSFSAERRLLWGLCYRMTGSASDAEDIVQETFVRALEKPPSDLSRPWRPWLVRVAINLSRDLLRRRRRRPYPGPWLPEPIVVDPDELVPAVEPSCCGVSTEARYELLESISFAFLVALEALTPLQRAVLLLRDVFDYGGEEVAEVLGISLANAKVSLHRARRAMADYDAAGRAAARAPALHAAGFAAFLAALQAGDADAATAALSPQVRSVSDGGGVVHAARKPVVGRERVVRFHLSLQRRRQAYPLAWDVRTLNGQPALVGAWSDGPPGDPRRFVILCDVDPNGQVATIYTVVAPAKLERIRFAAL